MGISNQTKNKMNAAGKMAMLFGVISLASSTIAAAIFFFFKKANSVGNTSATAADGARAASSTSVLLSLVFSMVTFMLLNRFAVLVKKGFAENDGQMLERGFNSIGSYFKMIGVLFFLLLAILIFALFLNGMR